MTQNTGARFLTRKGKGLLIRHVAAIMLFFGLISLILDIADNELPIRVNNVKLSKALNVSFRSNPNQPFYKNQQEAQPIDTVQLKGSGWFKDVIARISKEEYRIQPGTVKGEYVCVNSKNALEVSLSHQTFTLSSQHPNKTNWQLQLHTEGFYADNKLISVPDRKGEVRLSDAGIHFIHNEIFTTEYVNSEAGVRQNFIVTQKPEPGARQISIQLKVSEAWYVNKVHNRELHFALKADEKLEKKITYNGLKVWDADGKEVEASFAVNRQEIAIVVDAEHAVYPLTIDPLSSTANTVLDDADENGGNFGWAVSSAGDVNGDGYSDVIIGAPYVDNFNPNDNRGKAFVYHGSATGLSTTPNIVLADAGVDNAGFGYTVSTAGDVNGDGYSDVIVTADQRTDGASANEGRAYIYHGSATGLGALAIFLDGANAPSNRFGHDAACAGDVNNDGYSDIIVSAFLYTGNFSNEGAIFIYHGSPTGLINTPSTTREDGNQNFCVFGDSVAGAGDINGDGFSDVIVGTWSYDGTNPDQGRVWIYYGSAAGIGITPTILNHPTNQEDASFGGDVSSAGDVNGDGYSDVLVGAYGANGNINGEGQVYVYHGAAAGINTTAAIVLSDGNQPGSGFGEEVSSAGDINGDGFGDVIIGAGGQDVTALNDGQTFVYYGSSIGLAASSLVTQTASTTENGVAFSYGLASAGDVNGDGFSDLVMGAPYVDDSHTNEGKAYVFHGSPNNILSTASWNYEPNEADTDFSQVFSAGDVNADGFNDVVLLLENYDGGSGTSQMTALLFNGSLNGLSTTPGWTYRLGVAPIPSISLRGNGIGDVNGDGYSDVMIGLPYNSNGESFEGQALAFYGSATGLAIAPNWSTESNIVGLNFAASMAPAGDVNGDGYGDAVIGGSANNGSVIARAFVYFGSATGLPSTPGWQYTNTAFPGSYFGISVAGVGDVNGDGYSDIGIGADRGINANLQFGQLYIFNGSPTGPGATYNRLVQENTPQSGFGNKIASAGDVNGDGYSDVIVGAYAFDNGETDEGRAYIYHGSATGLNTTASWITESDQASAFYGYDVSSAGDVNGDGYSDVLVSAIGFENGQAGEGRVYVYSGSNAGVSTAPFITLEPNQANINFGISAKNAGDVNGDGLSDIVAVASGYSNGQSSEGRAYLFYGGGIDGIRNNVRLYNNDLITPIQRLNYLEPNTFGAGLFVKSPIGRDRGKLSWEVRRQGQAFTGNPITNSTLFTSKAILFSDLGIGGTELKSLVQKQGYQNKIRIRVEYSKAKSINGQVYGPWKYPQGYLNGTHGMNAIPLPVKLLSFTGIETGNYKKQLSWITTNEVAVSSYDLERSTDNISYRAIQNYRAKGGISGQNFYEYTDEYENAATVFYRLRIIDIQGNISYSNVVVLGSKVKGIDVFPNPAKDMITLRGLLPDELYQISIADASGRIVMQTRISNNEPLVVKHLAAGSYYISAKNKNQRSVHQFIKH